MGLAIKEKAKIGSEVHHEFMRIGPGSTATPRSEVRKMIGRLELLHAVSLEIIADMENYLDKSAPKQMEQAVRTVIPFFGSLKSILDLSDVFPGPAKPYARQHELIAEDYRQLDELISDIYFRLRKDPELDKLLKNLA